MSRRPDIVMSPDEVNALLEEQHKLQLGTANRDGTPHLVTMFYALIDGRIGFWTYRTSQKARNIERDPRVSCLIETGEDYFELRGVLVYGTAKPMTDRNDIRYVGSHVVRRTMGAGDDAIAAHLERAAAKRHAYLVEPTRIVSWDHRRLAAD